MENRKGQFETLVKDIEREIAGAEGGWDIVESWGGLHLRVEQRTSRDPSRSNNGGEYYLWKRYIPDGLGVKVVEDWSCDIAERSRYGGEAAYYDCIISVDGLERIAKLADVTIAAKAWLAKEPGCMARLKQAIRSLEND